MAPDFVFGIGLHQDEGRFSYLLRAPYEVEFDGRVSRTDAEDHKASLYYLSVNFPFKNRFVGQLEIPFASMGTADDIVDGTGDLMFRTRATVAGPLSLVASLRTGTGSTSIFPYASSTLDVEIGLAIVDTLNGLGPDRPVSWWVSLNGTKILNRPPQLEEAPGPDGESIQHEDYVKGGAGIVARVASKLDVQIGGFGYAFADAPNRQVYFADFDYSHSRVLAFFLTLQSEAGKVEGRAVNFAGTVGLRVRY